LDWRLGVNIIEEHFMDQSNLSLQFQIILIATGISGRTSQSITICMMYCLGTKCLWNCSSVVAFFFLLFSVLTEYGSSRLSLFLQETMITMLFIQHWFISICISENMNYDEKKNKAQGAQSECEQSSLEFYRSCLLDSLFVHFFKIGLL